MTTINKIHCIFLLGASLLTMYSCSDFLDVDLKDRYVTETYYTSEEAAISEVTGIYNSLYGIKWWVFGDVASDDAIKGGNAGDQVDISAIDDFSATADNGMLATFWQATYETISRANNGIAYIPDISMDETLKARLIGEAKFLRAFSYFNLANVYGKVPLKLLPQETGETLNVGLSEVVQIWAQIEQDLKDAIAVLPASYTNETGRATKGAAYGLLAKVSLYQGKYNECLSNITLLDSLKQYGLETDYAGLFKPGAEDSKEVLFGLRFLYDETVTLGNEFDVWMAPSTEGGYYFNAPTQSYVDAFTEKTSANEDDPRLDASIGRDGKFWFNGTTFSSSWSETGYLVKKYNMDRSSDMAKAHTIVPYHYLRYADILLMKAEAINELGGTDAITNAAAAVNLVRNRAGLANTTATTQADLRNVIRNERRKELGFEFHRFFDLMRWGKSAAQEALGSSFPWTEPRFYYPVPQAEIDANQAL